MIVRVTASVAAIVRIEVWSAATVPGFAVMVTVGTFRVPLPVNRAHPDRSPNKPIEIQLRKARNQILLCKGAVAKVLSLLSTPIWTGFVSHKESMLYAISLELSRASKGRR